MLWRSSGAERVEPDLAGRESLFGVLNAGLIVAFSNDAPIAILKEEPSFAAILGLVAFAGLVVWLYRWMLARVRV